tara:strand:+ start:810 stop:1628 length:819 start_codon:yes stop_codon:yes gene_type:complete
MYKLDLHAHTPIFRHLIFTKVDSGKYYSELLEKLFRKKGNLVLGIANTNNNGAYSKFVSSLGRLPKEYNVDMEFKDYFVSVSKGRKRIYFVKTDEIVTNRGHVLVVGFRGAIKSKKLKELFKEVKKQNCVVIATHPLHEFGIEYFFVSSLLGNRHRISIRSKELKKVKGKFDAIELNSYFPEDWDRIRKFGSKSGTPVIAESDAHTLDEFFQSWFSIKEIDFSDPSKFKKSLKRGLRKGIKVHARAHGFEAKYFHVLHVLWNSIGMRIGVVR